MFLFKNKITFKNAVTLTFWHVILSFFSEKKNIYMLNFTAMVSYSLSSFVDFVNSESWIFFSVRNAMHYDF